MIEVVWKEPPPRKSGPKPGARGGGKHAEYVAVLRGTPGKWALFATAVNQSKGQAMQSHYPGVEYTSRKRGDGRFDIYLRWNEES